MKTYQIVTDAIIKKLKEGTVPWHKPRVGGGAPRNLISRKVYRGINYWMLATSEYTTSYLATHNQLKKIGGYVKKGQKATVVVFWKPLNSINVTDNEEEETTVVKKKGFMLRHYHVFNLDQCWVPDRVLKKLTKTEMVKGAGINKKCQAIIDGFKDAPSINKGNKACYNPKTDTVTMPLKKSFESTTDYYDVLFHEYAHSTGHKSRLNRKEVMNNNFFGSEDYSKEELVAEMTSAFLCNEAGILDRTVDNSVAYIKSWIQVFKDDPKMVILAGGSAQKAADHILEKQNA